MQVMIATPTYSGQFCAEYVASLAQTTGRLLNAGIPFELAIVTGNPFVDLARNELAQKFLESNATDLLFIDDDVGWDAAAITRVLSHDKDVVTGLVPKRNALREDEFHQNALTGVIEAGLFQCVEAPTAFMRIRKAALKKFMRAYGTQNDGRPYRFFHSGTKVENWGEDIFFCRQWVALGEFIWVDSDITFSHAGRKVWRGNFFDHAVKTGLVATVTPADVSTAA